MTLRAAQPNAKSETHDVYFSPLKLRPFLVLARAANIDLERLLRKHGTSEAEMLNPETRLPRLLCVAVIRSLLEQLHDPLAGLRASEHAALTDIDVLGYLGQHCPTALAALQSTVNYARLVGDASQLNVVHEPPHVIITLGLLGGRRSIPELADFGVGSGHVCMSSLTRGKARALHVELARPRPADAGPYRKFFGAPVEFDAPRGKVVYAEAALLLPLEQSDARLAALLRAQAEARLAQLPRLGSLLEQVRSRLQTALVDGAITPSRVAAQLRMSERTLRRRLDASGWNFRALLDDVRRERALQLLIAGELSVAEIADQLGFSDATAFGRAFRRWTGQSPSEYRARESAATNLTTATH